MSREEVAAASLVGRYAELSSALTMLKEADQGWGRPIFIAGEPGVGKTRLAEEICEEADRLGFRILRGRALEFERELPYECFREALNPEIERVGEDTLKEQLGRLFWDFSFLFPETARRSSHSDPDRRARAYAGVARLLTSWSADRPTLLVLDDIHWADRASLELLSYLARRLRTSCCALVITLRPTPPDGDPVLVERLVRVDAEADGEWVALAPLDRQDTGAMVASLLAVTPSAEFTDYVFDQTKGNPFFVEELVRTLRDMDVVVVSEGRARLRPGRAVVRPAGAKTSVFHRIFQLGTDAAAMVRVAAVLGEMDLRSRAIRAAIRKAAGRKQAVVAKAIDQLVHAGILATRYEGRVGFAHPIVRTLVYEDLGPAEQQSLHETVGRHLLRAAERGEHVPAIDIATHLARSASVGDERAIDLMVEVADEARLGAPATAVAWYERALSLVPEEHLRMRGTILAKLASALFTSDRLEECARVARLAVESLDEGESRVRAAAIEASALTRLGRLDEAIAEVDRMLPEAGPSMHERLRAHKLAALQGVRRLHEAKELGEQILASAHCNRSTRGLVLRDLTGVAFSLGDYTRAQRLQEELEGLSHELSDSFRASSLATGGVYLALMGKLDDASERLEAASELCEELGLATWQETVYIGRAYRTWLSGDWDESIEWARSALLEAERSGHPFNLGSSAGPMLPVHIARGEFAVAREILNELRSLDDRPGARHVNWVSFCSGSLWLALGDAERAKEALEPVWDDSRQVGLLGTGHLVLDRLIEADIGLGDRCAAKEHLDALWRITERAGSPFLEATALRARATVEGTVEDATKAKDHFDELGMPFEAACTRLVLGSLGDSSGLRDAYYCFADLRAEPWRLRTASLLREHDLPVPRRRRVQRSGGLTDAERRVADLVAQGLSNREIGAALSLSPKTVEGYLSRVYMKTNCRSRSELAVAITSGRVEL